MLNITLIPLFMVPLIYGHSYKKHLAYRHFSAFTAKHTTIIKRAFALRKGPFDM